MFRRDTGYVSPLPPVQVFLVVGEAELLVDEDVLVEIEDELPELEELVVAWLELDEDPLVELMLWVLEGVALGDELEEPLADVVDTWLLDAELLLAVDVPPGVEVVSGVSGIGSVSVANGVAFIAIVQAEGVVVAEVDDDEGVALQPVSTDVLVVQLLLYNGFPELVVVGTGVHDTQLLVTVLVVHSEVVVFDVSVDEG